MSTILSKSEPRRSPARQGRALLVGAFLSSTAAIHSVGEDLEAGLTAAGWDVIMTSNKTSRLGRLLDMLSTVWRRRGDYEVAHVDVYSGLAFGWAEAVCSTLRRIGKPYVVTLRGGQLPSFARRWPNRVRRLLRRATAVTVPSRYLLEEMAEYREDMRLLPNPLDLKLYEYQRKDDVRPALVWLRAFHQIYDPQLAPRVVALLKPQFPEIRLLMVGPDKGDGSLKRTRELANGLGVAAQIEFVGGVPHHEVPQWLAKGDIFVNTTTIDNTPVSVLEAMACGLCVISTDVGGVPYLLDHEKDALLVPPQDPGAMAAAVRRVLTEPDLARRLSHSARQTAEQFGWENILPRWESLLSEASIRCN